MMTVAAIVAGAAALLGGIVLGRALQRRSLERASGTAQDLVAEGRRKAQEVLGRAEDEAHAKAETYREREEAAPP